MNYLKEISAHYGKNDFGQKYLNNAFNSLFTKIRGDPAALKDGIDKKWLKSVYYDADKDENAFRISSYVADMLIFLDDMLEDQIDIKSDKYSNYYDTDINDSGYRYKAFAGIELKKGNLKLKYEIEGHTLYNRKLSMSCYEPIFNDVLEWKEKDGISEKNEDRFLNNGDVVDCSYFWTLGGLYLSYAVENNVSKLMRSIENKSYIHVLDLSAPF